MRTWFEPEEAEEFEAAKSLLIRRCVTWAQEHRHPVDDLLLSAAVDARHESRDGRLAYWDEADIRFFLLRYVPYAVTASREELERAPEVLRTYLRYLDVTGLRDPRGATLAQAEGVIEGARVEYAAALDDPTLRGLATFWAHTALEQGVDLTVPGAFERFKRDLDAGRVPYDEQVLDQIMENRFLHGGIGEERAFPQPPVSLPPAAELAEAAAGSRTVQRLIALADWVGKDGRALTDAGNLRVADAREVSALLGTDEERLRVRSATDLPQLNVLLAWAKKLRLVRISKGRLLRVAKAAPLLRDPEALWRRAFEVLPELGRVVTVPVTTWRPEPILAELFEEILPDVLNSMYGLDEMPVVRLEETVWLACQEYFVLDQGEERLRDLWRREVALDLGRMFAVLAELGVVELSRGPADPLFASDLDHADQPLPPDAVERLRAALAEPELPLVRLTPLGVRGVRDRLLAEGRDAPLIGELATAPAAGLLGVLAQHYPPEDAVVELQGWLARPGQDVEGLLQVVRDCPFRTRAWAMLRVLADALPERRLLHELRHDPVLGPAVWSLLVDAGEMSPEALSERENLLMGAENFLSVLELAGPEGLVEQIRSMGGGDAYEFVEAILASGHPDVVGLRELRELVAEPLRKTARHPLRFVPTRPPGARGRRKKRKH
ncbi:hypothetical protein [Nonomuraea gerenzanensis]|uniref:Uncharacterized protein n=1 Tax=Nonomuraea gerenzanensis TaxID=93944 RepID=A0A1M4EMB7_9ACTN|nr:hypothetical protein [Nonomuraea gerenzanensis]UBU11509.1 hypothetical protein LCN96_45535 [Nonomuraea gerenzanensis]SBO99996.1 hypothetical protein BN4615_P9512 [Nonomuraea gerenzanensis]